MFRSPELKAQVSFSDGSPSSVCPLVCQSENFWHFHLLLQNHRTNFNKTWHKASFGLGDSSLFRWRATPFSRGDNYELKGQVSFSGHNLSVLRRRCKHFTFSSSSPESLDQFQPTLARSILGGGGVGGGIQVCSDEGPHTPFSKRRYML